MTPIHQQKLEAISEACIAVNPDITKVQFGCKYRVKNRPKQIFRIISDHEIASIKDVEKEIIGRDIQLADVLAAISASKKLWHYEEWGIDLDVQENHTKIELKTNEHGSAMWNLLLPFHLQDEPTISFLYELIV